MFDIYFILVHLIVLNPTFRRQGVEEEMDSHVSFLIVNRYNRYCDRSIINYQYNNTCVCRRDLLFDNTDNYENLDLGSRCMGCDVSYHSKRLTFGFQCN